MTGSPYLDWLAGTEEPTRPSVLHPDFGPDLIIGYATGYGPAELACFVSSVRAHSRARLALVASDHPETKSFLKENGVDHFLAPTPLGWEPQLLIGRFKHYLPILNAYPAARRVLITDVRDVAFQGDPFATGYSDDNAALALFCETPPGDLGSHGANPKWLRTLIGAPMADRFKQSPVVCGGSIMGEPAAVAAMIRQLLALCAIQRSGALNGIGADQAALNLIVHWGLANAIAVPNFKRVATIGYTQPPGVSKDAILTNPDGTISPIVHQYDRHTAAKQAVEGRWRPDQLPSLARPKRKGWAKLQERWRKSITRRLPEWR